MSKISTRIEENLASHTGIQQSEVEKSDVVLDANREVRAKLYLGSVSVSNTSLVYTPKLILYGIDRFRWGGSGLFLLSI